MNFLFWPVIVLAQAANVFTFDETGVSANTPLSKKLLYEDGYSEQAIASAFSDLEVYSRENCDGYGNGCIIVTENDAVLEIYPNSEGGILHIYGGTGSTDVRGTQIGDAVVDATETKEVVCSFGKWVTCLNPERPAVEYAADDTGCAGLAGIDYSLDGLPQYLDSCVLVRGFVHGWSAPFIRNQ